MDTQTKVAIIGGVFTVIAAIVAVVPNLVPQFTNLTDSSPEKTSTVDNVVPGLFVISSIECPSSVVVNGIAKDLKVFWNGQPKFPVTIVVRPRSCPTGTNCAAPSKIFNDEQNPLVFPGAWWCRGTAGWTLDYEVVMIDSTKKESIPYPALVYCSSG